MKISKEIRTAILVLSSIALFIWGYSFLKGQNIFSSSTKHYILYDNVEGLTSSSPVTLNGLIIGKVSKISIQENTGKLVVEIVITNPFDIPKSSIAYIYSPGFIGGKQIGIEPNFNDTDIAKSGDYLVGEIRVEFTDQIGQQLDPIQKKVEAVLEKADNMLKSVNEILDNNAQEELKKTITELSKTMQNVNAITTNVNALVLDNKSKLDHTMGNLTNASGNFSKLSDSLAALEINKTFTKLESASEDLEKIISGIEKGEGSVGKLLKDDKLYGNLTNASKELEELLRDLKENPKRYMHFSIFGKKQKVYVPADSNDDIITETIEIKDIEE